MNKNQDKMSEVISYLEKIIEDRKKSKKKNLYFRAFISRD